VKYKGYLQNNGYCFYKSLFNDQNRNVNWLVVSQMESIPARNAFPCFDEPELKAEFKLTIIHNKNLEAISNMVGNVSLL
jgi:aminopeptidase N